MSEAFVGEIRMFAGNFAPVGWAICDGQRLAITQNEALYSLIGDQYGGDAATFNLPDLRGRIPIGQGQRPGGGSYVLGEKAGTETVTLVSDQLPQHTHPVAAQTAPGDQAKGTGGYWAAMQTQQYFKGAANAAMSPAIISPAGTAAPQAHNNMMPCLAVNFIICLNGYYPERP